MENPTSAQFSFGQLWQEIPIIARLMMVGLCLISTIVVIGFVKLFQGPGPVARDENFYIHFALLFLVPIAALGLMAIAFGYAYYQLCKRHNKRPFWTGLIREEK